jgi:hypothetical protein
MPIINGHYVPPRQDPVEVASQEITGAMLDLEIAIRRAPSSSALLGMYLHLNVLTAKAVSLEKLALDRAEALQGNH